MELEQTAPPKQQKRFEVLLTSDQMKKLQKILPKKFSISQTYKNQRKRKKNTYRSFYDDS